MEVVIFRCKTKATNKEGNRVRFSLNWMFARRGELILTSEALVCGDWRIPYDKIEDAVLVSVPTPFGTACNLEVMASGVTYQFQLKSESLWRMVIHPFWQGPLPFPVRRETRRIG